MVHNTNISSNNETSSYVLSSTVEKAFEILEFIAKRQPVAPVAIAKELKFTRSNVHRLLATLAGRGYVKRENNGYYLTYKLFHLGNSIPLNRDLRDIAKPLMERLMRKVNENVYMNVLSEDKIIAIETVISDNDLILNAEKIYIYPLNSCASGKVFLSTLKEDAAFDFISKLKMVKKTEYTITDRDQLFKEIKRVGQKGYAEEIREFSDELNSVAAPVFDFHDQMIATISLSGPSSRLNEEKINSCVKDLIDTAQEITAKIKN